MIKLTQRCGAFALLAVIWATNALAQNFDTTLDTLAETQQVPVTIDNFVRAATDIELDKYVALAGGVNNFFHFRKPIPIDQQATIRMNRDTLYSTAVVDISKGATLTLPDVGDRYMTAMVVNQDHYINEVFYGGGTYTLDMETFDTPYVIVFMRFLVDASSPDDILAVNAIQDEMTLEAGASNPFLSPVYDEVGFEALVATVLGLGAFVPDSTRMFGRAEDVGGVRHFIGTAGGWGGLPEEEAFYLNIDPGLPVAEYKIDIPADVPVGAFWSVSLYNAQGFFEKNAPGAYSINSVADPRNDDGSMMIHLGGCDDRRINCLPIMEGWNYTVRLYRPNPEVINGSWVFPAVERID